MLRSYWPFRRRNDRPNASHIASLAFVFAPGIRVVVRIEAAVLPDSLHPGEIGVNQWVITDIAIQVEALWVCLIGVIEL